MSSSTVKNSTSDSDVYEDFATLNIELADIAKGRTRERSILPVRQTTVHPLEVPKTKTRIQLDRSRLARAMETTLSIVFVYFMIVIGITLAFIDAIAFPGGVFSRVLKSYEVFEFVIIFIGIGILIWLIIYTSINRRKARRNNEKTDEENTDEVSEGLNFLLRFGLVFFCMGSLILQMLRTISPLEGDNTCLVFHEPLRLTRVIAYIVCSILQSYFIFKHHRRKFCKHARIIRLALLHLTVVNLVLWFRTVVLEGKEMCETINDLHVNATTIETKTTPISTTKAPFPGYKSCDRQNFASKSAQIYLFPCLIQYALISAGAFANMYLRVEDVEDEEDSVHRRKMSSVSIRTVEEISTNRNAEVVIKSSKVTAYSVRNLVVPQTKICDKSHTGFFAAILFFVVYIIFTVIQLLYYAQDKEESGKVKFFTSDFKVIFAIADMLFHGFALILVIAVFFRMILQLCYHQDRRRFVDRSLMLITFFAQILFSFFLIHTNSHQVKNGHIKDAYSLARYCLQLVLFSCQTVLILTGINMRAMNEYQVRWKPGKNLLTILIAANLMFWFEESLLLSNHVYDEKYQIFYGHLTWCLLVSAFKPLVVFYKFHSASMLAEMWVNAYNFCILDLQQPEEVAKEEEDAKNE